MGLDPAFVAAGALAGAILGSFLGVLFVRLPDGRGFVSGRSSCDTCGRTLTIADLIPIVSFVWLRGRCRGCGAAIDPALLVIEVLAAASGAAIAAFASEPADLLDALYLAPLLLLAALDWRHHWLPDLVTLFLAGAGLVTVLFTHGDISASLIGAAAGFLSLEAIRRGYRLLRGHDGMGGGDPKLFGAIGLWTGWQALPFIIVGASAAGLLLALAMRLGGHRVDTATRLPLGTCLAISATVFWLVAAIEPFVSLAAL